MIYVIVDKNRIKDGDLKNIFVGQDSLGHHYVGNFKKALKMTDLIDAKLTFKKIALSIPDSGYPDNCCFELKEYWFDSSLKEPDDRDENIGNPEKLSIDEKIELLSRRHKCKRTIAEKTLLKFNNDFSANDYYMTTGNSPFYYKIIEISEYPAKVLAIVTDKNIAKHYCENNYKVAYNVCRMDEIK